MPNCSMSFLQDRPGVFNSALGGSWTVVKFTHRFILTSMYDHVCIYIMIIVIVIVVYNCKYIIHYSIDINRCTLGILRTLHDIQWYRSHRQRHWIYIYYINIWGFIKKKRPFRHLLVADRILRAWYRGIKNAGSRKRRKGERKTYHITILYTQISCMYL